MLRAYVRSFDAMSTIEKYLGTVDCVVRRYGMTLAYERIYLLDNFWSSLESSWPFWNRRVRLLLSTITCSDRSPSNSSKLQADVMMTWQNARSLPRPDFSQERWIGQAKLIYLGHTLSPARRPAQFPQPRLVVVALGGWAGAARNGLLERATSSPPHNALWAGYLPTARLVLP